jgi:hypothetical protein
MHSLEANYGFQMFLAGAMDNGAQKGHRRTAQSHINKNQLNGFPPISATEVKSPLHCFFHFTFTLAFLSFTAAYTPSPSLTKLNPGNS